MNDKFSTQERVTLVVLGTGCFVYFVVTQNWLIIIAFLLVALVMHTVASNRAGK